MKRLDGKRVLIIGGTAGMGRSAAELALGEGASVAITGRDEGRLEAARRELAEGAPDRVLAFRAVIEDRPAMCDLLARFAPFDHLVLPGSTVIPMLYDELTEVNARDSFESKFWGPFWAAFDARPHLRPGGSIVFFGGVAAKRPVRGYVVGGAINGALNAVTRSLALELAPQRVRVNIVAPGAVHTELWDRIHTPEEVADQIRRYSARLPVGRVGTAEEGGHAALFLMTNGFVNAQVIGVDGGAQAME